MKIDDCFYNFKEKDVKGVFVHWKLNKATKRIFSFGPPSKKLALTDIPVVVIKETIHMTDTIIDILHKIGLNCLKGQGKMGDSVFATITVRINGKLVVVPLPFSYEGCHMVSPYKETTYDPAFVASDGQRRQGYPRKSNLYTTMREFLRTHDLHEIPPITFYSVEEYQRYARRHRKLRKLSPDHLFYGIIQKYWPLIQGIDDIGKSPQRDCISYQLKTNKDQMSKVQGSYDDNRDILGHLSCVPDLIIYERQGPENLLNLYKLFKEFQLRENVPYIRLYGDSYLDACSKVAVSSISSSEYTVGPRCVSQSRFESWGKRTPVPTIFAMPQLLDVTNTLSLQVFNESLDYSVNLMIHMEGQVKIIFTKKELVEPFSEALVQTMLQSCNAILKEVSVTNAYSQKGHSISPVSV